MKKTKKNTRKFQSIVLKLVREKLNLMASEIMQLKKCNIENKEELVKTILIKIAAGKIKSAHINQEEAKEYLKTLSDMNIHQKVEPHFKNEIKKKTREEDNPFKDSPFH